MKNKKKVIENKVAVNKFDWYLDDQGVLFVSGEGKTPDFSCGSNPEPPWNDRKNEILIVCIGEGITELGCRSFAECENLHTVVLPNSLHMIHYECFKNCYSLTKMITDPTREFYFSGEVPFIKKAKREVASRRMGMSVGDIVFGNHAFRKVPWAIEKWGRFYIKDHELFTCFSAPDNVVIPHGIESVHSFAFKDWEIHEVHFPDTLKRIETCAFANTGIKEVLLPDQIKYVGSHAFADSPLEMVLIADGAEKGFEKDAFARTRIREDLYPGKKVPEKYKLISVELDGELKDYKMLRVGETKLKDNNLSHTVASKRMRGGYGIMRRLYMNSMILGIKYDPATKTVLNVKSLRYNREDQTIVEYIMCPCFKVCPKNVIITEETFTIRYYDKDKVYQDFLVESVPDHLVGQDEIRVPAVGTREEWFSIRNVDMSRGRQEMKFLESWLYVHMDYRVENEGDDPEDDKLGRFM